MKLNRNKLRIIAFIFTAFFVFLGLIPGSDGKDAIDARDFFSKLVICLWTIYYSTEDEK